MSFGNFHDYNGFTRIKRHVKLDIHLFFHILGPVEELPSMKKQRIEAESRMDAYEASNYLPLLT